MNLLLVVRTPSAKRETVLARAYACLNTLEIRIRGADLSVSLIPIATEVELVSIKNVKTRVQGLVGSMLSVVLSIMLLLVLAYPVTLEILLHLAVQFRVSYFDFYNLTST